MASFTTTAPVTRARQVSQYLAELWSRRAFALNLGLGNLKARNASTTLGLVWWVLNPLLLGGVYFLVFGIIFSGRRPSGFLAYLLAGMFVFHFTSQSMNGGANVILQNSQLLANVRFPRLILPLAALVEATVGFVASLAVLLAVTLPLGQANPDARILLLPAVMSLHLVFNLGLACLVARLTVPFRDMKNLVPYLTRIWLYLSPVIWPLSLLDDVSQTARDLVELNPMFHLITVYRGLLLGSPVPTESVVWSAVAAVAAAVIGVGAFIKYEGHMVRDL